nr:unnamed protein product [Callosobruchus chinensis]
MENKLAATNGGNTNIEAPLQELHNTRDHMETSPVTATEINITPYAESYGAEQDKLHRIIADQAVQIMDQAAQIKRLTDCVESLNTQSPTAPSAGSNIAASPSQAAIDTQAQQTRQGRVTPVVLRDATR